MFDLFDLNKYIQFNDDQVHRQMLFDTEGMRAALVCLKAGQKMEPHSAPFGLVLYCIQGSGIFIINDEEIPVSSKTVLHCEPGTSHGIDASGSEDMVVLAVVAKNGQQL